MNNNYDITDIVSVSWDYVRFCDGTMARTTPDILRSIISGCHMSTAIYRYMLHDLISEHDTSFRTAVNDRMIHANDITYQATRLLYELTGEFL